MAQATLSCPFGAIHLEGRCPVRTLGGGVDPTPRKPIVPPRRAYGSLPPCATPDFPYRPWPPNSRTFPKNPSSKLHAALKFRGLHNIVRRIGNPGHPRVVSLALRAIHLQGCPYGIFQTVSKFSPLPRANVPQPAPTFSIEAIPSAGPRPRPTHSNEPSSNNSTPKNTRSTKIPWFT